MVFLYFRKIRRTSHSAALCESKKMKRYSLILLLFSTSCATISKGFKSTGFIWYNTTLNDVLFEKSSMHIPVKFLNDSTSYYFQFDTGSNKSFLYTGSKSNPRIIERIKTKTRLSTSIGDVVLMPRKSNSTYVKDGKTFIGTIGSDILNNQILEIDLKKQKLTVLSEYNILDYSVYKMNLSHGRPVISLTIKGKEYSFLYDTGSSLFDLWTTKKLWLEWKNESYVSDEFPISSWGKINTSYRSLFENPDQANKLMNQLKYIWYNTNDNFDKAFKDANIHGIIGNRPFLNKVLLLDFKNKRIGIKKNAEYNIKT